MRRECDVPAGVALARLGAAVERRAVQFDGDLELGDGGVEVYPAEWQLDRVLLNELRHAGALEDGADAPDLRLALTTLFHQPDELLQRAATWQCRPVAQFGAQRDASHLTVP